MRGDVRGKGVLLSEASWYLWNVIHLQGWVHLFGEQATCDLSFLTSCRCCWQDSGTASNMSTTVLGEVSRSCWWEWGWGDPDVLLQRAEPSMPQEKGGRT